MYSNDNIMRGCVFKWEKFIIYFIIWNVKLILKKRFYMLMNIMESGRW